MLTPAIKGEDPPVDRAPNNRERQLRAQGQGNRQPSEVRLREVTGAYLLSPPIVNYLEEP